MIMAFDMVEKLTAELLMKHCWLGPLKTVKGTLVYVSTNWKTCFN